MLRNRRCRGEKFWREHVIAPYTVDFCCVSLKLVVEVDPPHPQPLGESSVSEERAGEVPKSVYRI